jgi:hypothetical protein
MAEAFGNLAFLNLFAMPFAACQITLAVAVRGEQ